MSFAFSELNIGLHIRNNIRLETFFNIFEKGGGFSVTYQFPHNHMRLNINFKVAFLAQAYY